MGGGGVSNFQEKSITKVHVSPLFVLRGDEWGPWGGCQICRKKALRKCTFHRYLCYKGMSGGGGVKIPGNKHYECVSFTFICYEGMSGGGCQNSRK